MSEAYDNVVLPSARKLPQIRPIGVSDLREALARGWDDYRAAPTQVLFLCALYPVIGFIAARAATGDTKPLLFPLLAGLSLMGPVAALGLYEISRQREAGRPTSWLTAFEALRSPAIGGIVVLAVALGVLSAIWVGVAMSIYGATLGSVVAPSFRAFVVDIFGTKNGWELIVFGNLVGAVFAVAVLSIAVVSFPMMLDRNCGPGVAVQTSLRAVARNPATMAMWGIIVGALLVLGAIPVLLGLAVVVPVLGHATWHLYRRVVV